MTCGKIASIFVETNQAPECVYRWTPWVALIFSILYFLSPAVEVRAGQVLIAVLFCYSIAVFVARWRYA